MAEKNVLDFKSREKFREWLIQNHNRETECWVVTKRGKEKPKDAIWYLDSVEEALCLGWIDTTNKKIDGVTMQKFMPRAKKSPWTELNKERCRRLEKLGLMTTSGKDALPDMSDTGFIIDDDIVRAFEAVPPAWEYFRKCPMLYQRVRIDSIQRDKKRDIEVYQKRLKKLIENSKQNKMFGDWNDYGRLLEY